jgi:hypothetical protein
MPSKSKCTVDCKEPASPAVVEVIPDTTMYPAQPESTTIDLYCTESNDDKQKQTTPFQHTIKLQGLRGEVIRPKCTFDDGAMVNAINLKSFQNIKHRLENLRRSNRTLCMADGRLAPSTGTWTGEVTLGNTSHTGTFEVFNSNGDWVALLRKPLLQKFKAVHDYDPDVVRIPNGNNWTKLWNLYQDKKGTQPVPLTAANVDKKQCNDVKGDQYASPSRQVSHNKHTGEPVDSAGKHTAPPQVMDAHEDNKQHTNLGGTNAHPLQDKHTEDNKQGQNHKTKTRHTKDEHIAWQKAHGFKTDRKTREERKDAKLRRQGKPLKAKRPHKDNIWNVEAATPTSNTGTTQKIINNDLDKSVLTRHHDPFKLERIDAVLAELKLGSDLNDEQCISAVNLLREFADCFALSMSEVKAVPEANHKLNILEGTKFKTKVNQQLLTSPQKEYFNSVLDKMLNMGIIAPINHKDIKCCGATTLAKKAHEGGGLIIEELQHRLNKECTASGITPSFNNLPKRKTEQENTVTIEAQAKWRVCQDFAKLNKITKVPPMPQGDI